ncbi:hypothetical protein NLX83_22430 [Allokutzneria sp. A3M-2-11 16]|uniref:hypothetical protein n=1 Tax=Allokutzneria sp. A3M-2-11 16 TaxID=2962043 RepID=UPI0020B65E30|nr:hypothetical protein [Allokutzneria sp. A3M-2-11 16]MCP3802027.1 hypothetical protein [Allokutzneria sp. A3M-2-11 16]
MPLLDLDKLTAPLSHIWAGFPRDWDRSLHSASYPETTRYNYLLAAEDPTEITKAHRLIIADRCSSRSCSGGSPRFLA